MTGRAKAAGWAAARRAPVPAAGLPWQGAPPQWQLGDAGGDAAGGAAGDAAEGSPAFAMVPDSFSPEDGRTPAAAAPPHAAAPERAAAAAGAAAAEPREGAAAGAAAGPPPAALDEVDAAPASQDEDDGDAEFVDAMELGDDEDERDHHGLTPEECDNLDDKALWDAEAELCARPAQLWGLAVRARGGALCLGEPGLPPGALHE